MASIETLMGWACLRCTMTTARWYTTNSIHVLLASEACPWKGEITRWKVTYWALSYLCEISLGILCTLGYCDNIVTTVGIYFDGSGSLPKRPHMPRSLHQEQKKLGYLGSALKAAKLDIGKVFLDTSHSLRSPRVNITKFFVLGPKLVISDFRESVSHRLKLPKILFPKVLSRDWIYPIWSRLHPWKTEMHLSDSCHPFRTYIMST